MLETIRACINLGYVVSRTVAGYYENKQIILLAPISSVVAYALVNGCRTNSVNLWDSVFFGHM